MDPIQMMVEDLYQDAKAHGIRMYEVAEQAGLSLPLLSGWRSGKHEPLLRNYIKALEAVEQLKGDKGGKQIQRKAHRL